MHTFCEGVICQWREVVADSVFSSSLEALQDILCSFFHWDFPSIFMCYNINIQTNFGMLTFMFQFIVIIFF